jgi:hypothetical protein
MLVSHAFPVIIDITLKSHYIIVSEDCFPRGVVYLQMFCNKPVAFIPKFLNNFVALCDKTKADSLRSSEIQEK